MIRVPVTHVPRKVWFISQDNYPWSANTVCFLYKEERSFCPLKTEVKLERQTQNQNWRNIKKKKRFVIVINGLKGWWGRNYKKSHCLPSRKKKKKI